MLRRTFIGSTIVAFPALARADDEDDSPPLMVRRDNGKFFCLVGFGLYRQGKECASDLKRQYASMVVGLGNDREAIFKNGLAKAINQLQSSCADKNVPFWVIAKNHTAKKVDLKFYVLLSRNKMTRSADDSDEYLNDRDNRKEIFEELTKGGEPLDEHTINLEPNDIKLQGISPATALKGATDRLYPVGLFSAAAAGARFPSGAHLMSYGLIRRPAAGAG